MTKKIAFAGTHSGGKTTSLYVVAGYLKSKEFKVEIVEEAARKAKRRGFQLDQQSNYDAQIWMFGKQLTKEMEARLDNPDYILCDRSVYDGIAYTTENVKLDNAFHLRSLALSYCERYPYDLIIYFPPMDKIEDDGVRATDVTYQHKIDNHFFMILDQDDEIRKQVRCWRITAKTKDERIKQAIKFIEGLNEQPCFCGHVSLDHDIGICRICQQYCI